MKIAVVGAGSYTFGPSVLKQIYVENRFDRLDLSLVDIDAAGAALMADVARSAAERGGLRTNVTSHTGREKALDGADFVICSVAVEGGRRFRMDRGIIDRFIPGHLVTEFGGIAGISYSLRQIAMIRGLCADMKRLCPDAWLLNVANPLPRVCQAAHESGVKTVGFCSASSGVCNIAWMLLEGERIRYPWTAARERWDVTMAGLNHFSWLLDIREKKTGEDVYPLLRRRLSGGATTDNPRCEGLFRETGWLPLPYDGHCADFLPPVGVEHSRTQAFHGDAEERRLRVQFLKDVASGRASLEDLPHEAWERPIDLAASMNDGRPSRFNSVDLVNAGQIPNLPRGVFVETPGEGRRDGLTVPTLPLPETTLPYALDAARVTQAVVRAAMERRRALVHEAVELDPTVVDKGKGLHAIDACLEAHADLAGRYG